MIYQTIIFTVLVFILKKLVFKKLVSIMDERKQHIENQLQLTEKYKIDAESNLKSSEGILKQAKKDAREIIRHSENEAMMIIQKAREEANEILREAKAEAYHTRTRSFVQDDQIKGA
ncbi:ATP synthase F0 subunit B [Neobacillus pocheonensis]|uniref:ATP synthase F0 subunit B n=1 Tax=Neobacillus pocheonensis TaxID=363869 RepID=UPI003D2B8709